MDPPAASQQQWDDGGNALAIDRRLMVCYERNVDTNARLEASGVEVIRVPGSELASGRGGPRAMSCPVTRDHAAAGAGVTTAVASVPDLLTAPARALAASVADLAQTG